jgi:hypothetical protein
MKPAQLDKLNTYVQENKSLNIEQLNEIIGRGESNWSDDDWSETSSILGYEKDLDLRRR